MRAAMMELKQKEFNIFVRISGWWFSFKLSILVLGTDKDKLLRLFGVRQPVFEIRR